MVRICCKHNRNSFPVMLMAGKRVSIMYIIDVIVYPPLAFVATVRHADVNWKRIARGIVPMIWARIGAVFTWIGSDANVGAGIGSVEFVVQSAFGVAGLLLMSVWIPSTAMP